MWLGALTTIAGGFMGMSSAKSAATRARQDREKYQRELTRLEKNRQKITNPYSDTKNLSSLATDLSSMVSNPFANLGVATQAAEIQMEQSDIALANTLDTLRSTGSSAGGATALAQAALQSKKGVSASIEMQEAQNEKLKAQGEQKMQMIQMQEKGRLQNIQISEGGRVQGAQAAGKSFMFNAIEGRQMQKLNRTAGLLDRATQQETAANQAYTGALTGMIGGLGSLAGAGMAAKGAKNAALIGQGFDPNSYNRKTKQYETIGSDRKLKKNIKLIGKSPKGLKIYAFEYIDKIFGDGVWQGVMSDEVPDYAVVKHEDGFDRVDYSKLDVTFKQI